MLKHVAILVVALAWCLAGFGCDNHGTDPPGDTPDYVAYMTDGQGSGRVYGLHLRSFKIDTIWTAVPARRGIAVSPDAKRLYLAGTGGIAVFDIALDSVVASLAVPETNGLALSADGRLVAVCAADFSILRASNLEALYADTFNVLAGEFSDDGSEFLGVTTSFGPDGGIYRLRLGSSDTVVVTGPEVPGYPVEVFQPCRSQFVYLNLITSSWTSEFAVLDPMKDSALYVEGLYPGHGSILVAPFWDLVFYTNQGTYFTGPPQTRAVYVFDTRVMSRAYEISTMGLVNQFGDTLPFFNPGSMAITPDQRKLVVISENTAAHVLVYDILNLTIDTALSIPDIPTPLLGDVALPRCPFNPGRKPCLSSAPW